MTFRSTLALGVALAATALAACSSMPDPGMAGSPTTSRMTTPAAVPAAVQVPPGHRIAFETVGAGTIVYACRPSPAAGGHAWVFVGPEAVLRDRAGQAIGRYVGPPATWILDDGSAVAAVQQAVAPAGAGDLPLQLVRAQPATGNPSGLLQGVTHIQRLATRGGTAPTATCDAASAGRQETVRYQADYLFWKKA